MHLHQLRLNSAYRQDTGRLPPTILRTSEGNQWCTKWGATQGLLQSLVHHGVVIRNDGWSGELKVTRSLSTDPYRALLIISARWKIIRRINFTSNHTYMIGRYLGCRPSDCNSHERLRQTFEIRHSCRSFTTWVERPFPVDQIRSSCLHILSVRAWISCSPESSTNM